MTTIVANKRAPSGKKLISLHLDGKSATVGMAEFIGTVLHAVGSRSTNDLERTQNGGPTLHVNAAGDLCVYVNEWSA